MNFHWSGQGGQPTWLWGSNDGVNHYVYNPGNFSVNYANTSNISNMAYTVQYNTHCYGLYNYDTGHSNDSHVYWAGVDGNGLLMHSSTHPYDNRFSLGNPRQRFSVLYAGTSAIATSDARHKHIMTKDESLFRAWGKINFELFKFKDSIQDKGLDKARIHVGYIAQQVIEAFASEGLDASNYGLFCYNKWDDAPAKYKTYLDEHGVEQKKEVEPARIAGDIYSLRYEECLCVEAAYQRWRANKLEARIARLEQILDSK